MVGHALGDDDVLERDAGCRPGPVPGGAGGVDLGGARERGLGVDVQVGAELAVLGGDAVEVGLGDLGGGDLAGGERRPSSATSVRREGGRSRLLPQDARHAEAAVLGGGRTGQDDVAGQARAGRRRRGRRWSSGRRAWSAARPRRRPCRTWATASSTAASWPAKRSSSSSVTASRARRARCAISSRVSGPSGRACSCWGGTPLRRCSAARFSAGT